MTEEDYESLLLKVSDAVADELRGTYICGRVWEAWSVGTMTEQDFHPTEDDTEVLGAIARAALAAAGIKAAEKTLCPSDEIQGIRNDLKEIINS